ncbi:MAG: hypothetical protein QXN05_04305 [Acidilobaceae archaeon]
MNAVEEALRDAVLYGLPIEYRVSGKMVFLKSGSKKVVYKVLELRDLNGKLSGFALAIPGLEAFSVKIISLSEEGFQIVWENIPLAVGLDRNFMSPAETDIWLRRFKLKDHLKELRELPEELTELKELGFTILSARDLLDYAVREERAVALWFNFLTKRVDLAMEVQDKMGLYKWGEKLEAVRKWIEKLKR